MYLVKDKGSQMIGSATNDCITSIPHVGVSLRYSAYFWMIGVIKAGDLFDYLWPKRAPPGSLLRLTASSQKARPGLFILMTLMLRDIALIIYGRNGLRQTASCA